MSCHIEFIYCVKFKVWLPTQELSHGWLSDWLLIVMNNNLPQTFIKCCSCIAKPFNNTINYVASNSCDYNVNYFKFRNKLEMTFSANWPTFIKVDSYCSHSWSIHDIRFPQNFSDKPVSVVDFHEHGRTFHSHICETIISRQKLPKTMHQCNFVTVNETWTWAEISWLTT